MYPSQTTNEFAQSAEDLPSPLPGILLEQPVTIEKNKEKINRIDKYFMDVKNIPPS